MSKYSFDSFAKCLKTFFKKRKVDKNYVKIINLSTFLFILYFFL